MSASINFRFLGKLSYHSAILLACVTLSCRPQQAVILSPNDNDLVVLNGCVISACNYLAVVKMEYQYLKSELTGSGNRFTAQFALGF